MGTSHEIVRLWCAGCREGDRKRWLAVDQGRVCLTAEEQCPSTEWIVHSTDGKGYAFQNRALLAEHRWLYGRTGDGEVILGTTEQVSAGSSGVFWDVRPEEREYRQLRCCGTAAGSHWLNGMTKDGLVHLVSDEVYETKSGTKWKHQPCLECQEMYMGFLLRGTFKQPAGADFFRFEVVACAPRQNQWIEAFRTSIQASGRAVAEAEAGHAVPFIVSELVRQAFARARARIVLEDYEENAIYTPDLALPTGDGTADIRSDREIRDALLQAFGFARRAEPRGFAGSVLVDLTGLRLLLGTTDAAVDLQLGVLLERRHLDRASDGVSYGDTPLWITANGLDVALPEISSKKTTPDTYESAFAVYKRIEKCGEGGCGSVYRVADEHGRFFALKLLDKPIPEKLRRFRNEIAFAHRRPHQNIVPVLDHGTAEVRGAVLPFCVMPLYGATLRVMMSARIEHEKVLPYFLQMLDGVEAAHAKRVFHRDLKPENILHDVSEDRLLIGDFGIAHIAADMQVTAVETRRSDRLANWQYAAPEQRERREAGAPADIYALGLILNEMFTGQVIYGSNYPTISSVAPTYGRLDGLVDRMVRRNEEERPESIGEVRADILSVG